MLAANRKTSLPFAGTKKSPVMNRGRNRKMKVTDVKAIVYSPGPVRVSS